MRGSDLRRRRFDDNLSEEDREEVWGAEAEAAKQYLGPDEVAAADAMSDDEVERGLAQELRSMKAERLDDYRRMLANLPSESRTQVEAIIEKYGI